MVKYFPEQANLFSPSQRGWKLKPENEISSCSESVISGLPHTRQEGTHYPPPPPPPPPPQPPADIIAAALIRQ